MDVSVVKHKAICVIFSIMTNTSIKLPSTTQKKVTYKKCVHDIKNVRSIIVLCLDFDSINFWSRLTP